MIFQPDYNRKFLDVKVLGLVQGVGFRYKCMWKAEELDLEGWVQNNPDDSVSLHLEGLGYKVDKFMQWLREGVPGALVSRVYVEPSREEAPGSFQIR